MTEPAPEVLRDLVAEGDLGAARKLLILATRARHDDDIHTAVNALRSIEDEDDLDLETLLLMLRALHTLGALDTLAAVLYELASDLEAIGARLLGRFPAAHYDPTRIWLWLLPENLGGHVLVRVAELMVRDVILGPDDLLEVRFGGLSAAMGAVPLALVLHRGESTHRLYQEIVQDTLEGALVPEDYRDELDALVRLAREHSGCRSGGTLGPY